MDGGNFSYALLAGLAIALLIAAFTDIRRREIDNGLNAVIVLAAPLWWLAMGYGWAQVGTQLALAAATFAVGAALFALRQMGGGDVKLLAALALWFLPASFLQLVVLMAILGGAASVAMAAFNMQYRPGERGRDCLAWLAAAGWVWIMGALTYALATGRPVPGIVSLARYMSHAPLWWLPLLAGIAIVLLAICGIIHITRRQKTRLPVPYGVAISAAGLWILGERVAQAGGFSGALG